MRFFVVALVACAPSQAAIDRSNTTALAKANAGAIERVTPFAPTPLAVVDPSEPVGAPAGSAPVVEVMKVKGMRDTEHFGVTEDGTVMWLGGICAGHVRCGGCFGAEYKFGHATDGHVVIARLRPEMRIVKTVKDNGCSVSCSVGTQQAQPPPQLPSGLVVGIVDPHTIEIRDEPYVVEYVDHECTNTTPVP